jgi:hypothetical protein
MIYGGYEILFEPFEQKKNPSNYKRYNRSEQQNIEAPYVDCADFGYLIIQLLDGNTPVCYWMDHISNYLDPNPKYKWVNFLPD